MTKRTALLIALHIILACVLVGCQSDGLSPLCRHVVLSQYAAFKDAGYECELWHMENNNPENANGFQYHIALRVNTKGGWKWVEQQSVTYRTSFNQPNNTMLRRKVSFNEVANWIK